MKRFALIGLLVVLLGGCSTTAMVPATLSETVQLMMEPVDVAGNLEYTSLVHDDSIVVVRKYKDGRPYKTMASKKVPQVESFRQVLAQYVSLKFNPIAEDSITLRVTLEQVEPVYQINESATSMALKTLFSPGTSQAIYYCSHTGTIEIIHKGNKLLTRRITSTANSQDIEAIGYVVDKRGKEDAIMAQVCNASMNRFVIQMDKLIDVSLSN